MGNNLDQINNNNKFKGNSRIPWRLRGMSNLVVSKNNKCNKRLLMFFCKKQLLKTTGMKDWIRKIAPKWDYTMLLSPQIEKIGIVLGTGGMVKETRQFLDQMKNKKHQLGRHILTFIVHLDN